MPQPLKVNPLDRDDSYKDSHWFQLPKDTEHVYSYLASRGGFWKHTMFFGLQYYLAAYLEGKVFGPDDVTEAADHAKAHFGQDGIFNRNGWMRLYAKHGGSLPLRVRAVPEGTVVPVKNVLMTIENTDPEFPWLTNWAETLLLKVWYPITVATLSFEIRQAIGEDLARTGTPSLLDFKLHDFGYRGVSSEETAAIGGAAHLVNFLGTDTKAALAMLRQYYDKPMAGFSIPAMEHSTVTTWGEDNEGDAYENMLNAVPKGLVACVIDSYDIYRAVREIFGDRLREHVLRRDGVVVLRPDSGEPTVILEDVFNMVAEKFGFETHPKGWKLLPAQIRCIQGDGVNYQNILRINSHLTRAGWSMDNWGYGMGGALLQQLNRDTQRFALKCSAVRRSGFWEDVYKTTKADPSKASMAGRFDLLRYPDGELETVESDSWDPRSQPGCTNALETVFEDGAVKRHQTLDQVRDIARTYDRFKEEEQ